MLPLLPLAAAAVLPLVAAAVLLSSVAAVLPLAEAACLLLLLPSVAARPSRVIASEMGLLGVTSSLSPSEAAVSLSLSLHNNSHGGTPQYLG